MIIYRKTNEPIPKKDKKPITSVTVVTKTLDAKAGSIFIFFKVTGIKIPNSPATIIFNTIEAAIIIERSICLNHSWTITAVIIAKIIPFNTPIKNSLVIILFILLLDNSLVAIALIVTANVCIPALPPIEATIGIRKAKATTFSISAPKILITHDANNAVARLTNNQLNLLLVFTNTVSVISSFPTPASLKTSSFDLVGKQLRHVGPLVFDTSKTKPTDVSSSLTNLQKVYDTFDRDQRIMNKTIFIQNRIRNASSHYQSAATLIGTKSTKFLHVATEETGSKVPHGLWDTAVPNAFNNWPSGSTKWKGKGLFVETWRKGSGPSNDGKVSICKAKSSSFDYNVVNVGSLTATLSKAGDSSFEFQKDHSKWAVSEDSSTAWVCFGDKNRELSQDKRGGGALCMVDKNLHATFSSAISVLGGDIWHGTTCSASKKCKKTTQTCVKCDTECASGSSSRKEGNYYCDTQDSDCGLKPPRL